MKVTDEQLDEYIALYKSEYGISLERTRALTQLHKLINLVLYLALPENQIHVLEEALEREYNKDAASK